MNVCGNDFPPFDELQSFDLVIHCGACMFNRRLVLSRIGEAYRLFETRSDGVVKVAVECGK